MALNFKIKCLFELSIRLSINFCTWWDLQIKLILIINFLQISNLRLFKTGPVKQSNLSKCRSSSLSNNKIYAELKSFNSKKYNTSLQIFIVLASILFGLLIFVWFFLKKSNCSSRFLINSSCCATLRLFSELIFL